MNYLDSPANIYSLHSFLCFVLFCLAYLISKHFRCYWPFVRGIRRSLVKSLHKGPVTQSFDVFFDLRLNKWLRKQPWCWHILSIPLTTGRGTGAETCELDDVFPPDDLCSCPEALC